MASTNEGVSAKDIISTAPLDEACKATISEIRSGILQAKNAFEILRKGNKVTGSWHIDEYQHDKLFEIMDSGINKTIDSIDEYLVGILLKRLESQK